ncbi:AP-2 complex subunit sigma [Acorus gramineus]|uniref:AP-2 complex subunit sigma n=1 Tax=Acorus gramineus TaxID=55184 RepID=A0AAV9AEZ5_ACOGR|nr:AP-2 complex subunit sigma [Acorus gramineus]
MLSQIPFILLQNRQGKTRLAKYYVPFEESEKHKVEFETKYCSPSVTSMRASNNLTRPNNNSTVSFERDRQRNREIKERGVKRENREREGRLEDDTEEEDELKKKMKTWSLWSRSEPGRRRSKETTRSLWAEEEEEQAGTGFKKSNRSNISWKCSCIETL